MKVSVLQRINSSEVSYAFEGHEIWHRGKIVPGVCKLGNAYNKDVSDELAQKLNGLVVSIVKDDTKGWIAPMVKLDG